MPSFIALYRGDTVAESRLVALTADPALVSDFANRLVREEPEEDGSPGLRLVEQDKEDEKA